MNRIFVATALVLASLFTLVSSARAAVPLIQCSQKWSALTLEDQGDGNFILKREVVLDKVRGDGLFGTLSKKSDGSIMGVQRVQVGSNEVTLARGTESSSITFKIRQNQQTETLRISSSDENTAIQLKAILGAEDEALTFDSGSCTVNHP